MNEFAVIWEWIGAGLRWLHIVCAMAWIGSSFYFIALDLGLRNAPDLPAGAHGEEWQVHGGGFYNIRKYLVAPEHLPEHLTWFKWESYVTWLSGFALLAVLYWARADLYLIEVQKFPLTPWQGIAISAASLAIGWLIYDALCRSKLRDQPTTLMVLLFALLMLMGFGYNQIFTGRATMLHLGAFTATIMTANVFFIIIPNQKIVVADLKTGRTPDPRYGKIAKLRSTHNNYLTLPVVFLMMSNHYPLAFATPYNWIIAGLLFLMGVFIRHFFNTKHARKGEPIWSLFIAAMLFMAMIWLSSRPPEYEDPEAQSASPREQSLINSEGFDDVAGIVIGRCSMCHGREVVWEGLLVAPKAVLLETDIEIARQIERIYLQSGLSEAMPPANVTEMTPAERKRIIDWYRAQSAS